MVADFSAWLEIVCVAFRRSGFSRELLSIRMQIAAEAAPTIDWNGLIATRQNGFESALFAL
jgi:hypothetical protein